MIATLLLLGQLVIPPLPPLQTTPPATVLANPERPAQWFVASDALAIASFEVWAVATHHRTISQFTQRESADHPWVRWTGLTAGTLLILHLFTHGPLW